MRAEVAAAVAARHGKSGRPGLAAVLVGDNPASQVYVRNKRKACEEAGLAELAAPAPGRHHPEANLLALVEKLNADPEVHGILVQLPLPTQIDEDAVIRAIAPGHGRGLLPPGERRPARRRPPAVLPLHPARGDPALLARNGIDPAGKEVVIVGRSNIVGKPLALMLLQKPTAANPAGWRRDGDGGPHPDAGPGGGLPAGGHPGRGRRACRASSPRTWSARGGGGGRGHELGRRQAGRGRPPAAWRTWPAALSPVPGGVGPMTITMLLVNTLDAAEKLDR